MQPPLHSELAVFLCPAHGIALFFGRWVREESSPAGFLQGRFANPHFIALFAFCMGVYNQINTEESMQQNLKQTSCAIWELDRKAGEEVAV